MRRAMAHYMGVSCIPPGRGETLLSAQVYYWVSGKRDKPVVVREV